MQHHSNVSVEELREHNCSGPETNGTTRTRTSSDGHLNCTSPAEIEFGASLLAERRYDLAVVCCVVISASLCFNAILVNRLVRRGGRREVGVARSSLMLNLVAGDWLLAVGGCGALAVALIGGAWPLGNVGCSVYSLSTMTGHVVAYYTLACFVVER